MAVPTLCPTCVIASLNKTKRVEATGINEILRKVESSHENQITKDEQILDWLERIAEARTPGTGEDVGVDLAWENNILDWVL